ncbi:mCG145062, partial [Mus musculus]
TKGRCPVAKISCRFLPPRTLSMAALLFPPRNFLCGLFSQALQWKGAAQVLRDVCVGKAPVFHHAAEHNAVCPHFLHRQRTSMGASQTLETSLHFH